MNTQVNRHVEMYDVSLGSQKAQRIPVHTKTLDATLQVASIYNPF